MKNCVWCAFLSVAFIAFSPRAWGECNDKKLLLESQEYWNFQVPFAWGAALRPINVSGNPIDIGARTNILWQQSPYLEFGFYFAENSGDLSPEFNIGSIELLVGEGDSALLYQFGQCEQPLVSFSHGEPAQFRPIKLDTSELVNGSKPVRIRIWGY